MPQEKPVLRPVGGGAAYKPSFCKGFRQLSQRIPLGSHFPGIPVGNFTLVHLEAVMMLRYGHHVSGSRLFKQISPFLRVEFFRLKHRDKILIAEFLMRPVGFHMMLKFRRSLNIHVPGIPLVGKGRNAVGAPMDKNTEFCLHEPVRHGMVPQALPGILIGSLCDYFFYFFQIFLQLRHQSVTTPFWSMTLAYSAVSPVAMIAYAFFASS